MAHAAERHRRRAPARWSATTSAALGLPTLERYVASYVARTGLDPRPHLPVYLAYNFFRIAAIFQGIVGRVRDGTATSEFAPAKALMVRPLRRDRLAVRAGGGRMKSFALALGGGGARGLGHIAVIEALDEMGVKPVAIAGASIGALVGAAYAAGMPAKEMRRHVVALAHDRGAIFRRLLAARAGSIADLVSRRLRRRHPGRRGEVLRAVPARRRAGDVRGADDPADRRRPPISIAAARCAISSGPLKPALAASIALPGLMRPVVIGERVLIDGGATNPLPFDHLRGRADVVVAVDISGEPAEERRDLPNPWEALVITVLVMANAIVVEKLRHSAPDLMLRPNVGIFRTLDFLQASAILRAAEPVKAEVKEKLAALIGS